MNTCSVLPREGRLSIVVDSLRESFLRTRDPKLWLDEGVIAQGGREAHPPEGGALARGGPNIQDLNAPSPVRDHPRAGSPGAFGWGFETC